jgi:hypothetical protein
LRTPSSWSSRRTSHPANFGVGLPRDRDRDRDGDGHDDDVVE